MKKIKNKLKQLNLDGHKTHITIIAMVITLIAYTQGYITEETFNLLDTVFLALIGFSLRDAIKKK